MKDLLIGLAFVAMILSPAIVGSVQVSRRARKDDR